MQSKSFHWLRRAMLAIRAISRYFLSIKSVWVDIWVVFIFIYFSLYILAAFIIRKDHRWGQNVVRSITVTITEQTHGNINGIYLLNIIKKPKI